MLVRLDVGEKLSHACNVMYFILLSSLSIYIQYRLGGSCCSGGGVVLVSVGLLWFLCCYYVLVVMFGFRFMSLFCLCYAKVIVITYVEEGLRISEISCYRITKMWFRDKCPRLELRLHFSVTDIQTSAVQGESKWVSSVEMVRYRNIISKLQQR